MNKRHGRALQFVKQLLTFEFRGHCVAIAPLRHVAFQMESFAFPREGDAAEDYMTAYQSSSPNATNPRRPLRVSTALLGDVS